jgi:P-type conjugative transfer protein TrbJ
MRSRPIKKRALAASLAGTLVGAPVAAYAANWATEPTQILNHLELVAQVSQSIKQVEAQLRMLQSGTFDNAGDIAGSITRVNTILRSVDRVLYRVDEVTDQYEALYPAAYPAGIDSAAILDNRAEQQRLARDAGLAAKRTSAAMAERIEALSNRTAAALAASQGAPGQTAAIQAGTQLAALGADLQTQEIALQAAHYRAVEARLDAEASAEQRARQYTRRLWRGVPGYGE